MKIRILIVMLMALIASLSVTAAKAQDHMGACEWAHAQAKSYATKKCQETVGGSPCNLYQYYYDDMFRQQLGPLWCAGDVLPTGPNESVVRLPRGVTPAPTDALEMINFRRRVINQAMRFYGVRF